MPDLGPDLDAAHQRLAEDLRAAFAVAPDEDARARTRAVLLDAPLLDAPAPTRGLSRVRRRLLVPLAATFLALSVTSAVAVPLSASALPGDALHGVRMASERIRLLIASNPGDEAQVHLSMARARTADVERALVRGRDDALAELARRFFEHLRAADDLRARTAQDRADRLSALIAAQRARFDAIATRVETTGPTEHREHPEEIVRHLREHEGDAGDERTPGPGNGNDAPDRGRGGGRSEDERPHATPSGRGGGREPDPSEQTEPGGTEGTPRGEESGSGAREGPSSGD